MKERCDRWESGENAKERERAREVTILVIATLNITTGEISNV